MTLFVVTLYRRSCRHHLKSNEIVSDISAKNCEKLFLPELHQISTNFDNFWQKDGKEVKIM